MRRGAWVLAVIVAGAIRPGTVPAEDIEARLAELWKRLGVDPVATHDLAPRPWLGVSLEDSADPPGARIAFVVADSPAARGGLAIGDVVVDLAGVTLAGEKPARETLVQRIAAAKIGERVAFGVVRSGERTLLEVALGERPALAIEVVPPAELPPRVASAPWLDAVLASEGGAESRRVLAEIARAAAYSEDDGAFRSLSEHPFRLAAVTHLMADPLASPHVAALWADDLRASLSQGGGAGGVAGGGAAGEAAGAEGFGVELGALVRVAAKRIDLACADPDLAGAPARAATLGELLAGVRARLEESVRVREAALSDLSATDREMLLEIAGRVLTGPATAEETRRFLEVALTHRRALTAIAGEGARTGDFLSRHLGPLARGEVRIDLDEKKVDDPDLAGTILADEVWDLVGRVVVGGPGANRYSGAFAVILDLGGDDLYADVVAGDSGDSIVLDLAGNDVHRSTGRSQAYGALAAAFLIDLAGDDVYRGADEVQGVGMLGVGVLCDLAGDDEYSADRIAQGAGVFGIGLLADRAGLDRYGARQYAQGFGFAGGLGTLADVAGNDVYSAGGKYEDFREPGVATASLSQGFGFGLRPWGDQAFGAAGGIGALVDFAGHDLYHADYFAQGASYWFSLGILFDEAGRDRYVASRYSQGAGIHLSVGVLVDGEGDDHYATPSIGVSQGCGHDLAVGVLADLAGNDGYVSGTLAQGAGNDNGFGVLFDLAGDDRYQARGQSQGHGTYLEGRGYGSLGLVLDEAGSDRYDLGGADGTDAVRTRWGYCLDRP